MSPQIDKKALPKKPLPSLSFPPPSDVVYAIYKEVPPMTVDTALIWNELAKWDGEDVPPPSGGVPSHKEALRLLSMYPHDLYEILFGSDYDTEEDRKPATIENANGISSAIAGTDNDSHTIMLDLDVPARLVPSSTPGHSHLYIDVAVAWETYKALLVALGNAGVLEEGYVQASINRKHTSLRLPWHKKGTEPF